VSPKGAQGIAQFMPGTAALRKLSDPFDPARAIPASAHYLSDLSGMFGSLGLAAAAYNAGEQRVADWLSGAGQLPAETKNYVMFITGRSAEEWKDYELSGAAEIGEFSEEAADKQCAGVVTQLSQTAVAWSAATSKRGRARHKGPHVTVWRSGEATTYSVLR
jgi:hypothetical protein